jgi:hypothetical protein
LALVLLYNQQYTELTDVEATLWNGCAALKIAWEMAARRSRPTLIQSYMV